MTSEVYLYNVLRFCPKGKLPVAIMDMKRKTQYCRVKIEFDK